MYRIRAYKKKFFNKCRLSIENKECKKKKRYGDNIDNNEYHKQEDSIEEIMHDLQIIGDAAIEDDRNRILIAKTLFALPDGIKDKVLSEVLFVLLEVYGIAGCLSIPVPKGCRNIEQPFILLNFSLIEKQLKNMGSIVTKVLKAF